MVQSIREWTKFVEQKFVENHVTSNFSKAVFQKLLLDPFFTTLTSWKSASFIVIIFREGQLLEINETVTRFKLERVSSDNHKRLM